MPTCECASSRPGRPRALGTHFFSIRSYFVTFVFLQIQVLPTKTGPFLPETAGDEENCDEENGPK